MKNMRKIVCTLLILMFVLPLSAFAQNQYVMDTMELVSESDCRTLEQKAQQIADKHEFQVYIVTVASYKDYGYNDITDFVMALFDRNDWGYGSNRDGAVFCLSMSERDYCFDFHGSLGDMAFTETGRDRLEQRVLPDISNGDYYRGFDAFLDSCEEYLTAYESGNPIGTGTDHSQTGYVPYQEQTRQKHFSIAFFLPGVIAAVIMAIVAVSPMRSAKEKREASEYAARNSLKLSVRQDQFLHRSVNRTPKPKPSSSHISSGGSYHHSSGGHSGRSGKF